MNGTLGVARNDLTERGRRILAKIFKLFDPRAMFHALEPPRIHKPMSSFHSFGFAAMN